MRGEIQREGGAQPIEIILQLITGLKQHRGAVLLLYAAPVESHDGTVLLG